MTKTKTIKIKFDLFGNSHLDAEGFVGNSCKVATEQYLAALSPGQKDDSNKPEFSMPNQSQNTVGSRW